MAAKDQPNGLKSLAVQTKNLEAAELELSPDVTVSRDQIGIKATSADIVTGQLSVSVRLRRSFGDVRIQFR